MSAISGKSVQSVAEIAFRLTGYFCKTLKIAFRSRNSCMNMHEFVPFSAKYAAFMQKRANVEPMPGRRAICLGRACNRLEARFGQVAPVLPTCWHRGTAFLWGRKRQFFRWNNCQYFANRLPDNKITIPFSKNGKRTVQGSEIRDSRALGRAKCQNVTSAIRRARP